MNTIFEHIKDREWDWFGYDKPKTYSTMDGDPAMLVIDLGSRNFYSLADLLANKSWCKAVWGKQKNLRKDDGSVCAHCKGKISIRNPKGICDHLYFPDNCKTCFSRMWGYERLSRDAFVILQQEGEEACIKFIKETIF